MVFRSMSEADTAPLVTWQGPVQTQWVDYNGHLRDAYYLLIFSLATDALMDRIGLDAAGRKRTGQSLFTLESHINYLHEVKVDVVVQVRTQLLGLDAKRLQVYHTLHVGDLEQVLSANEQMLLNVTMSVDLAGPGAAPFDGAVAQSLRAIMRAHQALPRPKYAGRAVALPGTRHV